ncbi:MAG: DUF1440 domain-containing protein [Chloroflexota bacterium]|nr:DUF1440 domain-containing protein [Chloroflexota bacterium]
MTVNRVIVGGVAGLVATAPMTVVMLALHRLLPAREQYPLPPEEITGILMDRAGAGDPRDREQRWPLTLLTHFGFGAVSGVGLAFVGSWTRHSPTAIGVLYSLAVWAISYLGWLPAAKILPLATRHPARRNLLMLVAHAVWGASAGTTIDRLDRWMRVGTTSSRDDA